MTWPILPSRSAYSMFCPGTANWLNEARNSWKFWDRLTASMAPISSLVSWPVQRSAAEGRPRPERKGTSDTIGPYGVSRMTASVSNHQRTPIRAFRSVMRCAGNALTSNRSLDAARICVPPQAIWGVLPMAKTGTPRSHQPNHVVGG